MNAIVDGDRPMQARIDDIPVYSPIDNRIYYWIPRSSISFYNIHVNLGDGVFRVGETKSFTSPIYIFDRSNFQWGEHQPIPEILSR